MGALEELLSAWRANPDAESTIALCAYLGGTNREDLVREVGASAETWHANDGDVMLSVGRMYLEADMLQEAQAVLVQAGKVNPRDGRPFRYLGEVLLRRGDAVRSEKVLARAMQLGQSDGDTRLWHDRSTVYVSLQSRVGAQAVAAEVARSLKAHHAPAPPIVPSASWPGDEPPTNPRMMVPDIGPLPNIRPPPRPRSAPPPMPSGAPKPKSMPPPLPPSALPFNPNPTMAPLPPPPAVPPIPSAPPVVPSVTPWSPGGQAAPMATPRTPLGGLSASQNIDALGGALPSFDSPYAEDFPTEVNSGFPSVSDMPNPDVALVLEHLARVGVYEPGGGAAPAWESAPRQRSRGSWVLILATVLIAGGGGGAYAYARHVTEQRLAEAATINEEVQKLLHSGRVTDLTSTDEKLSRSFELDSRSQLAAELWLQNRVMGLLMLPGEVPGIDSAVHRAREVEVPEERLAYGRMASFLAEGDLAGAAALLPKWDKQAGNQAMYQLTAGAALERAGDHRAIERYQRAVQLDKDLVIARIFLARAVLLELGAEKGKPILNALKQKTGDTPSTRALAALAWAADPQRPKEPPKEAEVGENEGRGLPAPLRPVPYVVQALQAIAAGERNKALTAIRAGVSTTVTPAMATRFGFLAIQAGDETLARRAALRALQFAAVYPGARVLASRVALLGGRLDEAKKAIEELDPRAPEVAVVRAVVAYEVLDTSELSTALEALGEAAKQREDMAAVFAAPDLLTGNRLPEAEKLQAISAAQVPWGELVAMDAALDSGDLEGAEKLVSGWAENATKRPVYALRLARLRRYQGKNEEAAKAAQVAVSGTLTARVFIERVYDLAARNEKADLRDFIAKYPTLLGPMTVWLSIFADGSTGRAAEAKVKASQQDLPPDAAPMILKVLVARSLAVAGDKRAKNYLKLLLKQRPKHPDLLKAAEG